MLPASAVRSANKHVMALRKTCVQDLVAAVVQVGREGLSSQATMGLDRRPVQAYFMPQEQASSMVRWDLHK